MINLYCNFKGSRRKIYKDIKKQLTCSHIIPAQEFTFGMENKIEDIPLILGEFTENLGYETKVLPGYLFNCDFFIPDAQDIFKKILEREYTLANSRYLLIQIYKKPSFLQELIVEMGRFGLVMIQLHNLKQQGYVKGDLPFGLLHMLQAEDIIGKNGKGAKKAAFDMIQDGLVTFVGGLDIAKAYKVIEDTFGSNTAKNLFVNNPRKVILDEPIY